MPGPDSLKRVENSRDKLLPGSELHGLMVAFLISGLVATFSATAWFWTGSHVIAAVVGVICLVVAVHISTSRAARQTWLNAHAGEVYLIATGRSGWREFIENNVAPVLPSNMLLEWSLPSRVRAELSSNAPTGVARPFVMRIEQTGVNVYSLNLALRDLKQKFPTADQEAQREVATYLARFDDSGST